MVPSVTAYPSIDPLAPLHEDIPAELARLSLEIATLTSLIEAAEQRGLGHLTVMFDRSRQSKAKHALTLAGTLPR